MFNERLIISVASYHYGTEIEIVRWLVFTLWLVCTVALFYNIRFRYPKKTSLNVK